MAKEIFELHAEERAQLGTGASRRLRHEEKVPAVLYGTGKDTVSLTLDHNKVIQALENEAFFSHILTLNIGKKSEKVILKAIQRHPYKPKVLHLDFQRIKSDQKLHMNIPLHIIGEDECPGIKSGGVVSKIMTEVEVICLPKDLPEFIEIDISATELDTTLHLFDIKLPKGVELTIPRDDEEHNAPVLSIHKPHQIEEPAEDTLEADAEGEEASSSEASKDEESESGKDSE